MKRANFKKQINAPIEKVWDTLWNKESFTKWAAAFCEGSQIKSDWNKNGEVQFLGPDGNGMLSKIVKKEAPKTLFIEHKGAVVDGKFQPDAEETKLWKGAVENYRLTEQNGATELSVDVDIPSKYEESFSKAWPKALQNVKNISEEK